MAQNALAGAIAGFVARIAVAPIDLIKIRLQIQTNPISQASKFKYKGLFGTMKTIVKEEGVFALWKGNVPAQVMQVMSFLAIKFSTYNAARDLIRSVDKVQWTNTHEGQLSMNFVAGGIAGASATIDVVRSSVVAQEISALWRASGLFAFYQGLVPSLISIVPYMAIQLSTFEAGKAAYMRLLHMDNVDGDLDMSSKKLGLLPSTIIGAAAGGFSKFATLPLDLCKKRMQMNMASGKGVFQTMSIIAREEGVKALWKGGLPAVFKTIPATAITFAVPNSIAEARCLLIHL
ncbi:hypothetical protein GUITHDRAFT_117082 [Guillardia theta CCMP2712]|uniref:Uncharacterized protein n=1 Tax=Guillardia theta (strain CCMP2712) TaxID=905079 RepID=L1IKN8_GUITC|nr:hypothetical protein GUITHDRAFT_117082 [Guillardia theta CCMP2712]EKX36786.1 hypothetical protein GUITHDRAFT_117082 [Guillardia theta CCMP2712]|eukprot:XP_005823766.1 hypothetical protein GUITHDRAFT_117082 [Guillardia theta CCMP2712]